MSDKLFNALETCLQTIEQGETLDAALARFPALAAELRPILETSLHARTAGGFSIPSDAQRRGRAKVLQHAAELREAKRAPRRTWLYTLRPLAVTLTVLLLFLFSSTGLVRASSTSLPGDGLYPVKRTWEDVRLVFVHSDAQRESLEVTYENERVEEVSELLAAGRSAEVSFSGRVTAQMDGQWTVAGVPVYVSNDTSMPQTPVAVGAAVTVTGYTDAHSAFVAQSITAALPSTVISTLDDSNEREGDSGQDANGNGSDRGNANGTGSGSGEGGDAQQSNGNSQSSRSKIAGKVEAINGDVWIINGKPVNISGADIIGIPRPGAHVVIEGYYDANGVFIATRVVFANDSNENGSSSNSKERESESRNSNDGGGNENTSNDGVETEGPPENSNDSGASIPATFLWPALTQ